MKRVKSWLLAKYSAGATRASSWWANGIGLVGAGLPDLINWLITNSDLITGSLPTMSLENKVRFLLAMNAAAFLLRMYRQASVQQATITQAAEQGRITSPAGTDAIVIRSLDGEAVAVVHPADSTPGNPGV
jgi:hypothetical protein